MSYVFGWSCRFPLQLTFWPGGGATCSDEKNSRPWFAAMPNRGGRRRKVAGQRAAPRRGAAGRYVLTVGSPLTQKRQGRSAA